MLSTVGRLIHLTHARSRDAKARIERVGSRQLEQDAILLGGSALLAFACAAVVMRTSAKLYQRMTAQSEQLMQVSWRLLDNQEMVARRLSHELHDELGQVLTALKANFTRHVNAECADPKWVEDCSNLLKDSIRSAHEISQLLRPTILDDFGLTPAFALAVRALRRADGNRGGVLLDVQRPAAAGDGDAPFPHCAGGADERYQAFGRHAGYRSPERSGTAGALVD